MSRQEKLERWLTEDPYGAIQRFLCRNCGFSFSEKSYKISLTDNSQLCAIYDVEAKKLDYATETKTVAGEEKQLNAQTKA